jgi:hypothetical protein
VSGNEKEKLQYVYTKLHGVTFRVSVILVFTAFINRNFIFVAQIRFQKQSLVPHSNKY